LSTPTSASAATNAISIDDVAGRIHEISSLPAVALRVMEIAGNPNAGAGDLKAVVEADPALCVRMLRCVNSATYSLRREISDVGQAISILGFNRVRDLAVTATVSELFRSSKPVGTYERSLLWKHLAATAIGSRMIAIRARIDGFEDAFLAGLLHDIGIILLDQHYHDGFRRVVLSLNNESTLPETEHRLLGWDHTDLGHRVGSQWRLPRTVLDAIRFHHAPQAAFGPHAPIVHCVAVANLLVSLKGLTSVGLPLIALKQESLDALRLTKDDLRVFVEDFDHEFVTHRQLFEIQKG
jgi:HD-like signal output (HDOD) protein